jgi:hypothetical protein
MQFHKISSNGIRVEIILVTPNPAGQPDRNVIVLNLPEAVRQLGYLQAAVDACRRNEALTRQRERQDKARQLQHLRQQIAELEAQLQEPEPTPMQDTPFADQAPKATGMIVCEGIARFERVGPPTARSAT